MHARAALLLALALAGCLSALEPGPPADPSSFSYLYRADDARKAPHPATIEGAFTRIDLSGPSIDGSTDSLLVEASELPGQKGRATITIANATGTFAPAAGDTVRLSREKLVLAANAAFALDGVTRVEASSATVAGGRVRTQSLPGALFAGPAGGEPPLTGVRMSVGATGAKASEVAAYTGPDSYALGRGTLTLDSGTYLAGAGTVSYVAAAPLVFRGSPGAIGGSFANGTVELRGAEAAGASVRMDARSVSGTIDAGRSLADLDLMVVQWWTADRPQFEAALRPSFDDGEATRAIELARGANRTVWIRVAETSNVGTAPNVRPKLDAGALNATYGMDWYSSADPHVLEHVGSAFKNLFFGLFVDFTIATFEPGETKYIPLYVEAPGHLAPGEYRVSGWFHGDNALSRKVELKVTVA